MSQSDPPTQGEESVNSVVPLTDSRINWRSEELPEDSIIKCPAEKEARNHLAIEVEFFDDNTGNRLVTLGIFVCRYCGNLHSRQYKSTPQNQQLGSVGLDDV